MCPILLQQKHFGLSFSYVPLFVLLVPKSRWYTTGLPYRTLSAYVFLSSPSFCRVAHIGIASSLDSSSCSFSLSSSCAQFNMSFQQTLTLSFSPPILILNLLAIPFGKQFKNCFFNTCLSLSSSLVAASYVVCTLSANSANFSCFLISILQNSFCKSICSFSFSSLHQLFNLAIMVL